MIIVIEKREPLGDYIAYPEGNPSIRGYGKNWTDAVGDLVLEYPEKFDIGFRFPAESAGESDQAGQPAGEIGEPDAKAEA